MIFNEKDWYELAELFNGIPGEFQLNPDGTRKFDASGRVLRAPYAGYKPDVAEAPNGDTVLCPEAIHTPLFVAFDTYAPCSRCKGAGRVPNVAPPTTRYLHVAPKYNPPPWAMAYLARAHYEACRVAEALGVPAAYYPRVADGTLRVLDYDVGGSQPEHTDPDLFTIVLYRSTPEDLELTSGRMSPNWRRNPDGTEREGLDDARVIDPLVHIGEIGELVGLGPATPHRVPARPYRQQSIVYFAIPDHVERLPCAECGAGKMWDGVGPCRAGQTVGKWLKERLARSRVYK